MPQQPTDDTWVASKMAGCRLPPSMRQIWCRHSLSRSMTSAASSPAPWTLLLSKAGVRGYSTILVPNQDMIHPEARFLSSEMPPSLLFCISTENLHLNFPVKAYVGCCPILCRIVPDFNPAESIFMADDDGIILVRSLPELLRNLHLTGYCISPLTPLSTKNLAVSSDGRFRIIWDLVEFVPLGGLEGGSISADYRNAEAVLTELLVYCHGEKVMSQIRIDLDGFFRCLRNCKDGQEYYICHHGSLVPLNNRADVFMKLYYCIKRNLTASEAFQIISLVPLTYYNGLSCFPAATHWRNIAMETPALESWSIRGGSTSTPPATKPKFGKDKLSLFNLHRNVYCHMEMSAYDMNLLMYALYPSVLTSLMHGLWRYHPEVFCDVKLEDSFN